MLKGISGGWARQETLESQGTAQRADGKVLLGVGQCIAEDLVDLYTPSWSDLRKLTLALPLVSNHPLLC